MELESIKNKIATLGTYILLPTTVPAFINLVFQGAFNDFLSLFFGVYWGVWIGTKIGHMFLLGLFLCVVGNMNMSK